MADLDYSQETPDERPDFLAGPSRPMLFQLSETRSLERQREDVRGDLARGLLWLLTLAIGGVLAFVGLGRLDGTVITQSIFPSLIALAGTALGFYFGSQSGKSSDSGAPGGNSGGAVPQPVAPVPVAGAGGGAARGAGAGQAVVGKGAAGGAAQGG